jgi:hypothetical protein
MAYQRYSIWLRNLGEALCNLGEHPIDEHLARSLHEAGYTSEKAARFVVETSKADERVREEEALLIARTLARAGLKGTTTGYSDET